MKNKHLIPLITGAVIAVIGVNMMVGAQTEAADSAIECARGVLDSTEHEHEHYQLDVCGRDAKRSEGFWGEMLILALLGWGAGAFGYSAGSNDVAEEERKRRVDEHRREHPGKS